MSGLVHAKSFRELLVYQKARGLAKEIFELSKQFPREEAFALTDQIRRSSRSIGANIAEAWAKRKYERHFLSKLTDADGEQLETLHWLGTALDCGYVTATIAQELEERCAEIGRMLNGMMEKAELFCGDSPRVAREASSQYFVTNNLEGDLFTDH